ncbi:uncharacterized protein si:dkeyp-72g9.4 [Notolabrus celidotus]|uniref:uncharacterized protein si:dkeyp-72g9.4 n=1 Tax=Notolabrus celidotus TaxID=1203425 RepID=UPI00148FC08F|nr:uncharacterized protein si:dkeyp-72g9.4 [Notolabrus celidotus]
MRPRSRLLSKRRLLLPTIREGSEEAVRDLNEANSLIISSQCQAVSSEDYLLSICHLAHPTFPNRDVSPQNRHSQQLDAIHQRLRVSRTTETTSSTFQSKSKAEAHEIWVERNEGNEQKGGLMFGKSDPLEYLYGHQNNFTGGVRRAFAEEGFARHHGSAWEGRARSRAHSIPRSSSPDVPRQRKSSCPELHTSTNTLIPNISPKHTRSSRRGGAADRGAEGNRQTPIIKQSLLSQWISDCRMAWREARARACMLPAIAEI